MSLKSKYYTGFKPSNYENNWLVIIIRYYANIVVDARAVRHAWVIVRARNTQASYCDCSRYINENVIIVCTLLV